MRSRSTRARAALGAGTIIAAATGTAVAAAQTPAPSPEPAATAAAAAPAQRAKPRLRLTGRHLDVRAGRSAVVRGSLQPGKLGRLVTLQRRGHKRWVTIDRARTGREGRFVLRVRPRSATSAPVRVRFGGDGTTLASTRRAGHLTVYRPAFASWYGPGLYGNHLACGGTLTAGTVGVAHKTLPCGTKLTLRNGNREVAARVVDRGPYVGGREFDLTAATKQRLGFGSTGTVWVATR
jgi:rare lipoprotein A